MKTSRRVLAMVLVLAMLISNVPVTAFATETPTPPAETAEETVILTAEEEPTEVPTEAPTEAPAEEPTEAPTEEPTEAPTEEPTEAPTEEPTEAPTEEPTEAPTEEPTEAPTEEPTEAPAEAPTEPTEDTAEETVAETVTETISEEEAQAEEEEALSETYAPFLGYRYLSLNENGEWYEDTDATMNTYMTIQPTEFYYQGRNRYNEYQLIFYLNTYDGESWTETPVSLSDLSWTKSNMVMYQQTADVTGSNQAYYCQLIANTDAWDASGFISYAPDSDVAGISYQTTYTEGAFYLGSPYDDTNLIAHYECDTTKSADVLYFYFQSEDWEMVSAELDSVNGAGFATMAATGNDGEYTVTLNRNQVNVADNMDGMLLQVNCEMRNLHDDTTEIRPVRVICYAEEEVARDPIYLSYYYLDNSDSTGKWYLDPSAPERTLLVALPLDPVWVIFYLNVWNEDTQEYDMTPLTIDQISYATNYMSMEYIPADQCEDALEQYFIQITPNTDTCWGTTSYFYHTVDANTTVSLSCYLGRVEHGLYIIDAYNGDISVFNDATVVKRDRIDMNEGADNSFYFFFEPNHSTWTFKSVALNPVEGANLATMECVDEANHVYKITPTDETVQNAETLGNFRIVLDVEKYQNATGWVWTDNDTLWYNPPILPGESGESGDSGDSGESGGTTDTEHLPFLSYGDLGDEGDGWYETRDEWGEADGATVLGYVGWNMTPYDECKHIFYLNTWNAETQGWDTRPVHVQAGDYLTSVRLVDDPEKFPIRSGEENAEYFVNITTDVWDKTSQVSYTMDDGTVLTMDVTIGLPETGFYSAPEMTNENYLPNNSYTRDPYNEEHAYYFGLYSDNWTLTGVEKEANGWEDMFTISEVDGQPNMRKITLDPEYATTNISIEPSLKITAVDSIGYTNEWDWIAPSWTHCPMWEEDARIEINGETYLYYDEHDLPTVVTYEGYSETWGHDIYRATVRALPAGTAFDRAGNTITLTNAQLESIRVPYLLDDGRQNLTSDNLTIQVVGTNTIASGTRSTLDVWGGANVTITSDSGGSLYLKSTNSTGNVDGDGYAYSFDTISVDGGALTVQGNVNLTVEIAGEGRYTQWDDSGNVTGTEKSVLSAIRSNQNSLILKDTAILTTVVPAGAKENGTKAEDYNGGYRGLENFLHVNIQGGTLNTQRIEIRNRYDDNGVSAYGSYTQTGGTVSITALGNIGEQEKWEWSETEQEDVYIGLVDHYHYNGISAEHGGQIQVSGGSLNISVEPTEAEGTVSSWFQGISTYGGDVTISGDADVTVTGAYEGEGVRVGYHGDEQGNLIRQGSFTMSGGNLYVESPNSYKRAAFMESNTVLNVTGGTISCGGGLRISGELNVSGGTIDLGYNIELDHGAVMNMTDGALRFVSDNGDPTVRADGESVVNLSGGTITGQGRTWDFAGETNISGGSIRFDGGDVTLGYNTTITGGTISVENANLITRGMTNIWGGEITVTNGQFINESDGLHLGDPAQYNEDGTETEEYQKYAGRNPVITISNDLTEDDPFRGFAVLNEHGYLNVAPGGQLVINSVNVLNGIVNDGMIHMTGGDIVINAESTPEWSEAFTEYDENGNAAFVPESRGLINADAFRMEMDAGSALTIDADLGIWAEYSDDTSDGWESYLDFCEGNTVSMNTAGMGLWSNAPVTISGADVTIDAPASDYYPIPAGMQIVAQNLENGGMTPGVFNMIDGTLEINVPETDSGHSAGLYLFEAEANFTGGTILATGDAPVIYLAPSGGQPNIHGSYSALSTETDEQLQLEKFNLYDDEGNAYPNDYYRFVTAEGELCHAVTILGGPAEQASYLSFRYLQNDGAGWYENTDAEMLREFGITAMRQCNVIFYWNTWNEDTEAWDTVPVIPELIGDYAAITPWADQEDPVIREGEENADFFVHMEAFGTLDYQEMQIRYDGNYYTFRVHTNAVAFYSSPEMTTETIIVRGHFGLDADAAENAVYISVYDPDFHTIENLSLDVYSWDEDYNALLTTGALYTLETITEGKLYKITINPEYVDLVQCCWKNFNLIFECDLTDADGGSDKAGGDIWINPPEAMAREAHLWFNSQEYIFYEGMDIVGRYEFAGHDEEGNEIYNWKRVEAPEGVSYDLTSNTLNLHNVTLADMSAVYRFDNGDLLLPDPALTINVTGTNTISSDDNYALNFWGGVDVTIQGDGELYAKTTNHNNTFEDGTAYAVDAVTLYEADLTLAGDVTFIAEVAGEGSHSVWDDNGNPIGTEKAHLAAVRSPSWNNLTIRDNATLTTVLPDGARSNGTAADNYAGGYMGIEGMGSILVQDNATVNTQQIGIPCAYDGTGLPTGGSFTQTGGVVNITALAGHGENELYYTGLYADAGNISLTGGTMNITMMASEEELQGSVSGNALGVSYGELKMENAALHITFNCGNGISLGSWDETDENGNRIHGSMYAEDAAITFHASPAEDAFVASIHAEQPCEVTILGGTVNADSTRMYLNGPTKLGEHVEYLTETGVEGGYNVDGPIVTIRNGEFNINNESQIVNTTINLTNSDFWFDGGMMTVNGSSISITDGKMEVWAAGTQLVNTDITINNQNSESLDCALHVSPYSYFAVAGGTFIDIDTNNWLQGICNEGTFHLTGGEVDILMEHDGDWGILDGEYVYGTDGLASSGDTLLYAGKITIDSEYPLFHTNNRGSEDLPADGVNRTNLEIYDEAEVNLIARGGYALGLTGKAAVLGGTLNISAENGPWGEAAAVFLRSITGKYIYTDENGNVRTDENHSFVGELTVNGGTINIVSEDTGDFGGNDGIAKGIMIRQGAMTIHGGTIHVQAEEAIDDYVGEADENGNIPATQISGKFLTVSNNNQKSLSLLQVYVPDGGVGLPGYHYHFEEDNYPGSAETGFDSASNLTIYGGDINKCGPEAVWTVEDGVLIISGEGRTYDFGVGVDYATGERYSNAPWADRSEEITSIVVEEGITYVGNMAFIDLNKLTTISYPATLTGLGGGIVFGEAFTTYNIAAGNTVYRDDNDGIVDLRTMTLVTVASGKSGTYTVSSDVKAIGNGAFEATGKLNVILNNGLEKIGDGAFAGCGTETLVIPETVTTIGWYSFNGCTNLTEITIPASVTTMGTLDAAFSDENVFLNCPDLLVKVYCKSYARTYVETKNDQGTAIRYEVIHKLTDGVCEYCGETALKCGDTAYWKISDGVLTIYGTGALYEFTFDGEKTTAPWFDQRDEITSVVVEEGITDVGMYTFYYLDSMTSIHYPASLTSLGAPSAYGASFAEYSVAEGNPVYKAVDGTIVENGAKLLMVPNAKTGSFTVPAGVTTLGDGVFEGSQLSEIILNQGLKTIGNASFAGCFQLTELEIPNTVTSIGMFAFINCTGLREITIPRSVTAMGSVEEEYAHENVFYGCSDLLVKVYCDSEARTYVETKNEQGVEIFYELIHELNSSNACKNCDYMHATTVKISNVSTTGKLQLTWTAVEGAVKYQIYRSTNGTSFSRYSTTTKTSWVNTTTTAGNRYYYYVVAIAADGTTSAKSNTVNRICDLASPSLTLSGVASTGKIKVKWTAVSGAVKYTLQYSTNGNSWTTLKTTTSTSLTHTAAKAGVTYYYRVNAIAENTSANSAYSAVVSRTCDLPQPVISLSNVTSTGKIKVSWEAIDGAVEYQVYRAEAEDGEYLTLTTTTDVTWTDNTAQAGTTYSYKVMAIADPTDANSAKSEAASLICKLARPTITLSSVASSGKVKITWKAITGAVKYQVYYSTSSGGTYKLLKTTTGTSFTHTGGTAGTTYYYKVRAVAEDTAANSAYSTVKNRVCDLARPVVTLNSVESTGKIKLTWKAITGAVQYKIQRSADGGAWSDLKTTTSTSYTDTSAKAGVKYSYRVLAVAQKSAANSAYSTTKSLTCKLARTTVTLTNVTASGKIKVSWTKVTGAVGYEVYRALEEDGDYELKTTSTGTSWTDTSAEPAETYYYKVIILAEEEAANSAESTAKSRICDLARPVITITTNASGKPKLTWTKIDGAVSYKVYRSTSKSGSYTLLKTTTGTSYTNTNAVSGKTYYYKVIAVADPTSANSAYSAVKSITVK